MNFFQRQEEARKQSTFLLIWFFLCIVGVIIVVNWCLYFFLLTAHEIKKSPFEAYHWEIFMWTSIIIATTIIVGAAAKFYTMASGGISVALSLGAESVDRQTANSDERRLLNIVEEMALASGLSVPEVFVLRNEPGINAFAAGLSYKDAAITVSDGALKLLNRDELQGVIAHEFSHILNGDMRLNMKLLGYISGISILSSTGEVLMRSFRGSRHGRQRGVAVIPVIGLALYLGGLIGVFFARLLQSAISRQREYLADASAVQFTRNPLGIASALKKIGSFALKSKIENTSIEEVRHFFFASTTGSDQSWFATHPPLVQRIKAIDPHFNGEFSSVHKKTGTSSIHQNKRNPVARSEKMIPAESIMPSIGLVSLTEQTKQGIALDNISAFAKDPYLVRPLLAILFLDSLPEMRKTQIKVLDSLPESLLKSQVLKFEPLIQSLSAADKFRLIQIAIPSVKALSKDQFAELILLIKSLMDGDKKFSLFEFSALKLIQTSRSSSKTIQSPRQLNSTKLIEKDLIVILSSLSYAGHGVSNAAIDAYSSGMKYLGIKTFTPIKRDECNFKEINQALDNISRLSPPLKEKILKASLEVVQSDNKVNESEYVLIQLIAIVLECPLPSIQAAA